MVSRFHDSKKHTKCPSGWSVWQTLREFTLMRQGGLNAVYADVFGGAWESGHRSQSHVHGVSWWTLPPGEGQGPGVSPVYC